MGFTSFPSLRLCVSSLFMDFKAPPNLVLLGGDL